MLISNKNTKLMLQARSIDNNIHKNASTIHYDAFHFCMIFKLRKLSMKKGKKNTHTSKQTSVDLLTTKTSLELSPTCKSCSSEKKILAKNQGLNQDDVRGKNDAR